MNGTLQYKGKLRKQTDARRFALQHKLRQTRIEDFFFPKILNALKAQVNAFIDVLDSHGYGYAKTNIDSIIPFEPVAKVIQQLYLKASYVEANYVLGYLQPAKEQKRHAPGFLGIGFDELAPVVEQYFRVKLLNDSALPITRLTRRFISDYLFDEIDKGVPFDEAVRNFKMIAVTWTGKGGRSYTRAALIARTESTKAMSFGGLIGAYMSGVDVEKVWITSEDERVRHSHRHLDLRIEPLNGKFYNGEYIRFPGDPDASPSNTVGCRCSMYFRQKARPKPNILRRLANFLFDLFI